MNARASPDDAVPYAVEAKRATFADAAFAAAGGLATELANDRVVFNGADTANTWRLKAGFCGLAGGATGNMGGYAGAKRSVSAGPAPSADCSGEQ
jgi:hypothetical protein